MIRGKSSWDVVGMVETFWREGQKGGMLPGYHRFVSNRQTGGKRGGGIAVFVKEGTYAYEWERNVEVEHVEVALERIWVIIKGEVDTAVGIVYMAANNTPRDITWNESLFTILEQDIEALKEEKKHIVILGDFNGHMKWGIGGEVIAGIGTQGKKLFSFIENNQLHMINGTDVCKGKWTRMSRDSRSIIDYVMVEDHNVNKVIQMEINDLGDKLGVVADHNWIEVSWQHKKGEDVKVMKEPRWDFKNDQRWDKYRSGLCEALDSWEREAKLGKEVTNDIGVLESAYSNFIEDNIGMKDGRGSRATGKMGKTMSGLVKQRNKAWKKLATVFQGRRGVSIAQLEYI